MQAAQHSPQHQTQEHNGILDVYMPSQQSMESDTDWHALSHWLEIYKVRNNHTFRSYKREALRFRLFLESFYGDAPRLLKNASEMDVQCYMQALMGEPVFHSDLEQTPGLHNAPRLASNNASRESARRQAHAFNNNMSDTGMFFQPPPALLEKYGFTSKFKPFDKPVKKSTVALSLQVLSGMYEFWRMPNTRSTEPYVQVNPIKRIRLSHSWGGQQTQRYLPAEAIRAMHATLELEKGADPFGTQPHIMYQRSRWIFALLFGMWIRREEAINLNMGSFTSSLDGWTLTFKRKGGAVHKLPVPPWIMQELFDYREAMGMPAVPEPHDETPALISRKSANGIQRMTESPLYRNVKVLAIKTASAIQDGRVRLQFSEAAKAKLTPEQMDHRERVILEKLALFSPHWFRHSAATIAINTGRMSLKSASRTLSHKSEHITSSMYHHAEDEAIKAGMNSMQDVLKG